MNAVLGANVDRQAMKPVVELARRIEADPSRTEEEIDAFVSGNTFPLADADSAVFFFRSKEPVEAVYLVHWVFGLESRQPFLRLGETSAWYLPVELPGSARVEYKLEVVRAGRSSWVRDPLNPRQAFDPFGANSVCAMPGYHDPRWVRPETGIRPGRIVSFTEHSKVYGGSRETQVYLPSEYKPHKRYPLVICHDGRDYLRFAAMQTVLDNLIGRHEIAPMLVAFTNGHDRNREYGADPRQPDYVVNELLPWVTGRFGVSEDVADRAIMGASFGGVTSLFTAWTHPGVFGKLMLQSGSFVFTDIGHHGRSQLFDPVVTFVNRFRADPGRIGVRRIFLSCGQFESLIWFNRSLGPLLREAGIETRFVESADGHNWINWRDRLRDGLSWLYPGRLWMYYE
ncbi:MAG: esterase family protein [Myxococcales bacterium]|nr:esterase family protein [Myxococcales bacterium]